MVARRLTAHSSAVVKLENSVATRVVVVRHTEPKVPFHKRFLGLLTLLVIPGFLLATSLPALAVTSKTEDALALSTGSQSVAGLQSAVSTSTATLAVERGAFSAETSEQLAARKAAVARAAQVAAARAGAYRTVGPAAAGDDYPYRASGGGLSSLGYVIRQCTDFVAWRLNRDRGTTNPYSLVWSNMTPGAGSAVSWPRQWNNNGWQTSTTPINGAVAYVGNHIAYVKSVNGDGTVTVEEYNWGGSASYGIRTVTAGAFSLYLYPPP